METTQAPTEKEARAFHELDDGCAMAISACCGMLDAAASVGVSAELQFAVDALLRLHAAATLSVKGAPEPLRLNLRRH